MKSVTIAQLKRMSLATGAPKPFPGKQFPTRVAWHFSIVARGGSQLRDGAALRRAHEQGRGLGEVLRDPDIQLLMHAVQNRRTLIYLGKPNRYRALEAMRFLRRAPNEAVDTSLEVEFDLSGLLWFRGMDGPAIAPSFYAYHPHSGTLGPVDSFARHSYVKRIGGLHIYSYRDKLAQEEIDHFYSWFESKFGKRLKRPRGKAAKTPDIPNFEEGFPL